MPAAAVRKPPDWLGSYAKALWRRLSPVLTKAGLLSEGDVPALEMLCDEYDCWRRDPLAVGARDRYRRLLVEFGLTPSSRSRIKASGEPPKDELQIFLDRKA